MKVKPILVIVIILIIGFVLGMLTSAQIRYNKLKPVRLYFTEGRFREGFYKTVQPDEAQKAEIEKILEKYGKLNSELMSNFRKEFDSNMKEFRKEVDSKLTKEQLARLKEMEEKREEIIKQARRPMENDSTGRRPEFRRRGPGGPFPPDRRDMPPPPGTRPQRQPEDSSASAINR